MSTKVSEAKLNQMNKNDLVSMCSQLQDRIEAATAGPMTSAEIERTVLSLQKQVIEVREVAQTRKAAHEETLARIDADKVVSLKKLELEYSSGQGLDAEKLNEIYEELERKAEKAIEALTFKLKEAEVDATAKLGEIEAKVSRAEAEAQEKILESSTAVRKAADDSKSSVDQIKINHSRKVEQLEYDNAIALRDENLEVAEKIASKHNKVIVPASEYDSLKEHKEMDEKEVHVMIDTAVRAKSSEIYATEGTKFGVLKAETTQKIAILENDKKYLLEQVDSLKERVTSLETQVKDHPDKITAAVAASKADITVNQDAAGKR